MPDNTSDPAGEWPKQYPLELEDGRKVIAEISPITLADVKPIEEAYKKFSDTSLYGRFFTVPNVLPYHNLADRVSHLDHKTREALVARLGGRVIGIANYAPDPDVPGTVEAAAIIADDVQRRGLGTFMLRQLVRIAHDRGNRKLAVEYLLSNNAVKAILAKFVDTLISEEDYGISKRAVYNLDKGT